MFRKHFHKHNTGVICKPIRASFSSSVGVYGETKNIDKVSLSKAQQKKINSTLKNYHQYLQNVKDNLYHSFVVRPFSEEGLEVFMFSIRPRSGEELLVLEEVVKVYKHCIERVIEQLNLKSVDKAIDEILSGIQNIHDSNRELSARILDGRSFNLKRHIPTNNGALLLASHYDCKTGEFRNELVTWIHRKQFMKDQEVTKNEFTFVQQINLILAAPDRNRRIAKYKELITEMRQDSGEDIVASVTIDGVVYPWEDFIYHLEKGEYLDFMIDFEKFRN